MDTANEQKKEADAPATAGTAVTSPTEQVPANPEKEQRASVVAQPAAQGDSPIKSAIEEGAAETPKVRARPTTARMAPPKIKQNVATIESLPTYNLSFD